MFNLAEESIKANQGLHVIIVERIPRFDPIANDPSQIKAQLSQYANSIYHSLWIERGCPKNIHSVHDLGLNCFGPLKEKRYGIPGTRGFDGKMFDGIHMRGKMAVTHYTDSFICMLRPSENTRTGGGSFERADYHTTCPQTVYQQHRQAQYNHNQWRDNTQQQGEFRTQFHRGYNKNNSKKSENTRNGFGNQQYGSNTG